VYWGWDTYGAFVIEGSLAHDWAGVHGEKGPCKFSERSFSTVNKKKKKKKKKKLRM